MADQTDITVFTSDESESLKELKDRVRRVSGASIIVLPPDGFGETGAKERREWFRELKSLNKDRRLILATKHKGAQESGRHEGWEIISNVRQLKQLLKDHASYHDALRTFSPSSWRQHIRTRLQFIGLLSLPKLRIWVLLATSLAVFLFVFFKLLPSCKIHVWPNTDAVSYTTNIYLVASGAVLPLPQNRVHTLQLVPFTVTVDHTLTFDQVSKNFTGTSAEMLLTVFNDGTEKFSLRKGTRFSNQAGMVFRIKSDVILEPHSSQKVKAVADPVDLYNEIVGERGNVPAGIKWQIPALTDSERLIIYGRNEKAASGGRTSYANLIRKEDIDTAKKKLEQELLASAKQLVDDTRTERNERNHSSLVQLQYDVLTIVKYKNFNLSEAFIGQNVASFPVQGTIEYTVILYDESQVLDMMKKEIIGHVSNDKAIVESSLSKDNVSIHIVPPWDDDLKWVKITADLTYTERYILNPITPIGARFSKNIRDSVTGKSIQEAEGIVKNLPEVSKVKVTMWPPWAKTLPTLSSSIDVIEE